jgi:hypothetical protein
MFYNGVSLTHKGNYSLPFRNSWLRVQPRGVWMSGKKMEAFNARIRSLPAEIRMQVFSECLVRARFPPISSPALLAALRPDTELYEEAIEVFHKINVFEIKPHNRQPFLDLQDRHVVHLRKVVLYL